MKRVMILIVGAIMLTLFAGSVPAMERQNQKIITDQKKATPPVTKKTDRKVDAKKKQSPNNDASTVGAKGDGGASISKKQHDNAKKIIDNLK